MTRPLRTALIGIGTRARKLYLPLARSIAPWLTYSAVASPNAENAAAAGKLLGVPHFTRLTDLASSGLADAAIVMSSVESHHAVSVTLSRHGIHHLVETPMASTLEQARDMARTAREAGVTLLVAENYFRFPFDRLARKVAESGALGDVHRVSCYHDQVGWHGHARWIKFYDAYPQAVQCIAHTMPAERHVESARRIHESETFRSCHLFFPGNRTAIDMGGNLKGLIGRTARPGFTEIDGTRGAILRSATGNLGGNADVRIASNDALQRDGKADFTAAFTDESADGVWIKSHVDLPVGRAEWHNSHRPEPITGPKLREWDAAVVMEIMAQFADEARGIGFSDFSLDDALMTTETDVALRDSAALDGARITLGAATYESDIRMSENLRESIGIDPLDADAMVAHHFPSAF